MSTDRSEVPAEFSTPADMATEPQLRFLKVLVDERDIEDEHRALLLERIAAGKVTKKLASEWITRLKNRQKVRGQHPLPILAQAVAGGRYAIRGGDGVVKFYRVNKPTEGRWVGRTFVDVQASDEFHPLRDRQARIDILLSIAENPKEAMLLYGQELGACGHCGRTLTDENSRARGIGPICAGRLGW